MGFGNKRGGKRKENVFNQDKRKENNDRNEEKRAAGVDGKVDNRNSNYYERPAVVQSNPSFETFYRALQGFIHPAADNGEDSDWDTFLATLRSPLPACLRINPSNPFAPKLKRELQAYADAQFTTIVGASSAGTGDSTTTTTTTTKENSIPMQ